MVLNQTKYFYILISIENHKLSWVESKRLFDDNTKLNSYTVLIIPFDRSSGVLHDIVYKLCLMSNHCMDLLFLLET